MSDLVLVPVPGTNAPLQATWVDGEPFVALRPMCDGIGIEMSAQYQKLNQAEWARVSMIDTHDSSGRARQMFGLHADCVPMWLATINVNKVSEEARPVLIAYQREAARALRDYFYRGVAVQPSSMNQFDALRAAIDQIEATQRTATEAKEIAQRTDARLDAIEGRHDWFAALGYAKAMRYTSRNGVPSTAALGPAFMANSKNERSNLFIVH
jgi:hypothetical protein